jgi:adenylate cyclase
VFFRQRQFARAVVHFEKVSSLVESDFVHGGLLLTCYTALGDMEAARRAATRTLARAEKAVAIESDNGSAMGAVFSCLLVLGETDRAKDWARRATLIDPDNTTMRYNMACDMVIAAQDFETALELLGPVFRKTGREHLEWLKSDPDLDPIRNDPRFVAMLGEAEGRLAAARAPA